MVRPTSSRIVPDEVSGRKRHKQTINLPLCCLFSNRCNFTTADPSDVANKQLLPPRYSLESATKPGRRKHAPAHDISSKKTGIGPMLQFGDKVADGSKKEFSRRQIVT
jgi:hypothetical protein